MQSQNKPFKLPSGIYPEAKEHTGPTKPLQPPSKLRFSKKIIALFLLIVIAALFLGQYIVNHNSGIKLQPPAVAFIYNSKEKNCEKDVGDKNFCQFVARFDPKHTPFTETSSSKGANGYAILSILQSDGNNNASLVQYHNGDEILAATSLGGALYTKDDNDSFWTKYNAGSTETFDSDVAKNSVLTVSQIIDTSDVTGSGQISYKLVGKEYCGKLTCLKYQIIVQHLISSTHYIWFDSKYFLLRREYTYSSSAWSDNRFEYGLVNIPAPGPLKS